MNCGPLPCPEHLYLSGEEGTLRAGDARWILAATILGSSMDFIDGTVVNIALPSLQHSFGATGTQVQWVVEDYALFLASLLLAGGSFGDRFGLKRAFLAGVILFACASVWCGLAPNLTQLLIARSMQGIAGALLVPNSLAFLSASYGEAQRGRAIGTWSGFASIMTAVGPVIGGWLVQHASWRWVFFINLPIAFLTVWIVLRKTITVDAPAQSKSLDWRGALLSTLGLSALTYSLMEWDNSPTLIRLVGIVGIAMLAAFVLVERRAKEPMMPIELFRSRTFSGANILTFFLYAALSAALFYLPLDLIQIQGYTPTQAGMAMLPLVLTLFVLSRWAGGLIDRYGPRLPLVMGPFITACGYALFAIPGVGGPYWKTYLPALIVLGLGMAISVAPLTTTVMSSVSRTRSGAASGINNAISQTAALLAIAISSPLFYQAFAKSLPIRLGRHGVTADLSAQINDQSRRLGAIETRDRLGRLAVDESFVSAFRLIALVACGSATAAGITAAFTVSSESNVAGSPSANKEMTIKNA
jgi:EmrB/QacA subfamily drug resistance transporter